MTQYVSAHNDEASTASSLSAIAVALSQLAITQAAILERLPVPSAFTVAGPTGTGTNILENVTSAPVAVGISDVHESESDAVPASLGTVESAVQAGTIPPQPSEILVISESESDFESGSESGFESGYGSESAEPATSTRSAERAVEAITVSSHVIGSGYNVESVSTGLTQSIVENFPAPSEAIGSGDNIDSVSTGTSESTTSQARETLVSLESEDLVGAAVSSAPGAPPSYPSSTTGASPSYPGSSAHGVPVVGVALPITVTVAPVTSGDVNHADLNSDAPGLDSDSEDQPEVLPPTPDQVADSLVGVPPPPDGKWYVVTAGKAPGVYSDWDETATYVNKVSGAVFKKFPTKMDALWAYKRAYIAGRARVIL